MFKALFATALFAVCSFAVAAAKEDTRVFELRTYHAAPGKLDALLSRFRDHTCKLFEKHGMTNVGYWVPAENPDRLLIYLLAYPDRAARDAAWKGFSEDPDWKAAAAASEKDGKLVDKADSLFLTSLDFSPGFPAAGADKTQHLFELRTYTTGPKLLPALQERFRKHTLELFKKHGITNLAYFQLTPGQEAADVTLVYFLQHKDQATATASWEAFRADPVWVAAKKASEDAAGGSLTVPDGVKSVFLKPVDFSPVQ